MSLIGLEKVEKGNLKKALANAFNSIGFIYPRNATDIVIKPNMCYYWDKTTGQTTDPDLVGSLIELLREKTSCGEIAIVESDASAMSCKYVFKYLGFEKLASNLHVKLVNLSDDKTVPVSVRVGQHTFNFQVPETIQKAQLRINIPKIKYTVKGIEITCALKNIFGCNPYPKKFRLHPRLSEVIVALNKAMPFSLHVVDANIVSGVQPRRLGLLMAGEDPVAIDAAAAKIAGLNPRKIEYLKIAEKEGLGRQEFFPKGSSLEYFRDRYPRKDMRKKLMSNAYSIAIKTGFGRRLGLE